MPNKKKVTKQKNPTFKPLKTQHIKQVVNINIPKSSSKRKSLGGGRSVVKPQSSGYIMPGPSIPHPQTFMQPQDRQMLLEDIKKSIPQLMYQYASPPKMITEEPYFYEKEPSINEPTFSEIGTENISFQEVPTTDIPLPSRRVPPTADKIQESKAKLAPYPFPDRIAQKGSTARDTDIDAVVEIMYNANQQGAGITAADLNRVYGIDPGSVKKRLENITGIKSIRRSKIPSK